MLRGSDILLPPCYCNLFSRQAHVSAQMARAPLPDRCIFNTGRGDFSACLCVRKARHFRVSEMASFNRCCYSLPASCDGFFPFGVL